MPTSPRRPRNPLIGTPDGYQTTYPVGAQVSGVAGIVDYRAAVFSLPLTHDGYTPAPDAAPRPAAGVAVTPYVGLRVGVAGTMGPYLNAALAGASWKDYRQRIAAAHASLSVGYLELRTEYAWADYEVPTKTKPVEGYTYYGEAKYTFAPRFFAAARAEVNNYPFINKFGPAWVGNRTDLRDWEGGVGYRVSPTLLLKTSYRWDKWKVTPANAGFVRPGGHAIAVQVSQSFDVLEMLESRR